MYCITSGFTGPYIYLVTSVLVKLLALVDSLPVAHCDLAAIGCGTSTFTRKNNGSLEFRCDFQTSCYISYRLIRENVLNFVVRSLRHMRYSLPSSSKRRYRKARVRVRQGLRTLVIVFTLQLSDMCWSSSMADFYTCCCSSAKHMTDSYPSQDRLKKLYTVVSISKSQEPCRCNVAPFCMRI